MNPHRATRGEIQGLRAIAVVLVLLFHVWPDAVPGGYVGVDVFFVISGYLIVGSLAREAERDGRVSLLDFYSRRVRRLLPAATLVLAFALVGMFLWLPEARWEDTLAQVAASALYAENWYLAWAAVDYLASENAASPVQHYWSLSIEEQFYIVWPLIVLGAAWLCRRTGMAVRPLMGVALGLIFVSSLAASLLLTASDPGSAYFVTHTRAWELALGGLMAIWLPRIEAGGSLRAALCLAGLAAILTSGLAYSAGTPFPGHAALAPTFGAALVILAGDVRAGFFRGLDLAPLRYLGDISYSLYLWHWPLIVFWLAAGRRIGAAEGLALIAVTIMVSHFSHRLVEEKFRHPARPLELRPLLFGSASILAVVVAAGLSYLSMVRHMPADALRVAVADYPGPAALVEDVPVPGGVPLLPAPARLGRDRALVYDDGCHQNQRESEAIACTFGDPGGAVTVAVVGSSHSVNWLPAMDVLGRKNGWKVVSITKSACGFRAGSSDSCGEWHANVVDYLSKNPVDVVFIGENASQKTSQSEQKIIAGRWQRFADLGLPILTIRPIPHLTTSPGDCLPDRVEDCVIPRAEAERGNSIEMAAETVPGVHVLDMTDAICDDETCGPVAGNMIVYRDKHHLTATYSAALAPYLERELVRSHPGLLPIRDSGVAPSSVAPRPSASIACGPAGSRSRPFSRDYHVVLEDGRIVLRRGDWQKREKNFEVWTGSVEGRVVTISGRYVEGPGGIKKVRLAGTVHDDYTVVAAGTRGPRTCSLVWPIGEAAHSG